MNHIAQRLAILETEMKYIKKMLYVIIVITLVGAAI